MEFYLQNHQLSQKHNGYNSVKKDKQLLCCHTKMSSKWNETTERMIFKDQQTIFVTVNGIRPYYGDGVHLKSNNVSPTKESLWKAHNKRRFNDKASGPLSRGRGSSMHQWPNSVKGPSTINFCHS